MTVFEEEISCRSKLRGIDPDGSKI